MLQKSWDRVPLEELHFSWIRFQIFQNTIDFVIKVVLWLRLTNWLHVLCHNYVHAHLDNCVVSVSGVEYLISVPWL